MKPREVRSVPVDRFLPDPAQPRKVFSEETLLGLAKTLKEGGQLQPVLAFQRDGQMVIIDGERRWRAAKLAGIPCLDVVIVDPPTPEEALQSSLIANIQREDLSPIERAKAIDRLMKSKGWPASQVAAKLGLSAPTVSRLLALLELPGPVQEQVARGSLAASTAYQIGVEGGRDAASKERLASEVVERRLSRAAFSARGGQRRKKSGGKAARPRFVAVLGQSRTVTLEGAGLTSLEALVAWLRELLDSASRAQPAGLDLAGFCAQLRKQARAPRCEPVPSSVENSGGAS